MSEADDMLASGGYPPEDDAPEYDCVVCGRHYRQEPLCYLCRMSGWRMVGHHDEQYPVKYTPEDLLRAERWKRWTE